MVTATKFGSGARTPGGTNGASPTISAVARFVPELGVWRQRLEVEGRAGPPHVRSDTKIDLAVVGLGIIALFLGIAAAPFAAGVTGSYAIISSAYSAILFIPLMLAFMVLLGGAFLLARGLWYPRRALPSDRNLLQRRARRRASLVSRLAENGTWALITGTGMLLMGFLAGIPSLNGTQCLEGPCTTSDVASWINLAL